MIQAPQCACKTPRLCSSFRRESLFEIDCPPHVPTCHRAPGPPAFGAERPGEVVVTAQRVYPQYPGLGTAWNSPINLALGGAAAAITGAWVLPEAVGAVVTTARLVQGLTVGASTVEGARQYQLLWPVLFRLASMRQRWAPLEPPMFSTRPKLRKNLQFPEAHQAIKSLHFQRRRKDSRLRLGGPIPGLWAVVAPLAGHLNMSYRMDRSLLTPQSRRYRKWR